MNQGRRGCVVVTAVTLAALCSAGTALTEAQAQTQTGAEGASALTPEALRWAYPASPPGVVHPADEVVRQVPGSPLSLTRAQIEDPFNPPDWFPDEHPLMPEVVAHGRRPAVRACAQCHLPNGLGHPQSANLAGLPAAYFVQQMRDFKSGVRKNSGIMTLMAEAATDADVQAAADYFASLTPQPWVRIVEAEMVPTTHVGGGNLRLVNEDGSTEPLGQRIIEVPEDGEQVENRNAHAGFVAYVPVGSIAKGEALVMNGGGKTIQCGICHGADLQGIGDVPPITGRSPIGTVRQLINMQNGSRNGPGAAMMKPVVDPLSLDDIISIAAYTSSR